MTKFECNACGGQLKESGKFYICENCGTKYLLGRDDEGQPFTYQPIEKKDIECGQMGVKASEIEVSSIVVREIKLKDTISVDVHNESLNLDKLESIKLAELYVRSSDWESAQRQINKLLIVDSHCAEAQWYSLMCNKNISDEKVLISTWINFLQNDKLKLDDILENSSPEFAGHIIDLIFENAYTNDFMCLQLLATILPYAKNEIVYTEEELSKKIAHAFEIVIASGYEQAFMFLLTHTLGSNEVDKYINYLEKFAGRSTPETSQKYYKKIIDVDPGNIEIRRKLIEAEIASDTDKTICINHIEGLLKCSKDADAEVLSIINQLISEETTTLNKSKLLWDLIGYHSKAPAGLKNELISFAFILLNSSLWGEARNYLNLVLSINSRTPEAFWGLCLARIQARNEKDIAYKKDNIIDCSEFDKCLALYQAENNEDKVSELMAYTKKQKEVKTTKKKTIKFVAVAAAVLLVIFIVNRINYSRKYSLNNIEISVADKEDYQYGYGDDYVTELTLKVKNKSSQYISELVGELNIYDISNEELLDGTAALELDAEPGETVEIVLEMDSSNTKNIEEINSLDLEDLKITFRINTVYFEGYEKEYKNSKKKTINKITNLKFFD